jgi:chlorobactene glucosyltransferase
VIGTIAAVLASLPWIVAPIVTVIRVRNSRTLDEESADAPEPAPMVSVVIPARNEARNIERCVRSVLSTTYPNLEVIVVDDHSEDDTGAIARRIAGEDSRVRVVANPPLPADWFGKQWACANGASAARGGILCFTDADTFHHPDLIARSVNAMARRKADLFSVASRQELGSFWEKLIQPQIFAFLALRYGGTETVTNSPRVTDKIANGQCIFLLRDVYESLGGHALVRDHVAEDMMLAQRAFARGKRIVIVAGVNQLSARMYTSLREMIDGWGKNVFAGGRDSMMFGRLGKAIYPVVLLSGPLIGLIPPLVLLLWLAGFVPAAVATWAAITSVSLLLWWLYVYHWIDESPAYAFLSPLGAAVVFYILLRAVLRGQSVKWKGRRYVSR